MIATFGEPGLFGVRTRVYRNEDMEGVYVEARITYDVVQPDNECGVYLNSIVQ